MTYNVEPSRFNVASHLHTNNNIWVRNDLSVGLDRTGVGVDVVSVLYPALPGSTQTGQRKWPTPNFLMRANLAALNDNATRYRYTLAVAMKCKLEDISNLR